MTEEETAAVKKYIRKFIQRQEALNQTACLECIDDASSIIVTRTLRYVEYKTDNFITSEKIISLKQLKLPVNDIVKHLVCSLIKRQSDDML